MIKLKIRRSKKGGRENFWVIDVYPYNNANDLPYSYIHKDGTRGTYEDYPSEEAVNIAAALFWAKQPQDEISAKVKTCNNCADFRPASKTGCARVGYGTVAENNPCDRFKPKIPLEEETSINEIRTFETGATRDTVAGKLDYVKALCPLVLRRYVQYLDEHRLQPDGSIRDFDNWKKGIPRETYHSSKGRHFFADWLLEESYEVSDNHGPVDEENALCGELFNTMGKLREILRAKLTPKKDS